MSLFSRESNSIILIFFFRVKNYGEQVLTGQICRHFP